MQALPRVNCCVAVKICFKKYAICSGRSRRSEFWYFELFNFIIDLILSIPIIIFRGEKTPRLVFEIISLVYHILTILPNISVSIRRLHDTGRSGYYYLINLIPIVGNFIVLYYMLCDSQEQPNEYGPSPKYIEIKESLLGKLNDYNEETQYPIKKTNYSPIQLNQYNDSEE